MKERDGEKNWNETKGKDGLEVGGGKLGNYGCIYMPTGTNENH